MTIKEIISNVLFEERNGGNFGEFHVEVGEFEGDHIPHIHLDNEEASLKKRKKSAIRLDMNRYFIHGDKTYRLNSKERKQFVLWLISKVDTIMNPDKFGNPPKNNYENLLNIWNTYYNQNVKPIDINSYRNLLLDYKE